MGRFNYYVVRRWFENDSLNYEIVDSFDIRDQAILFMIQLNMYDMRLNLDDDFIVLTYDEYKRINPKYSEDVAFGYYMNLYEE